MAPRAGRIYYSKRIKGEERQHDRPVRFDYTDRFVGVQSYESDTNLTVNGRVLLSRKQMRELIAFYADPVGLSDPK